MTRGKITILTTGALAAALVLGSIGYAYAAPIEGESEEGAVEMLRRAGGGLVAVVSDLTGLELRDVAERRADGESFAQIAESEGVSTDEVKEAAVTQYEESLDERINSTEPPKRRRGPGAKLGGHAAIEALTEMTGLEPSEIRDARESGQSFADIADSAGVDIDDVIDAAIEDAREHLQTAVENGRIDADEVDEILEEMRDRFEEMVESTEIPEGRGGPMGGPRGPAGDEA
jgi:hypothetical protein